MKGAELLWERFRQGDRKSVKLLLDRYFYVLKRFTKAQVKDDVEFRGIILQALHILWDRRAEYNSMAEVEGTLFIIVRNKSVDLSRQPQYQVHRNTEPLGEEAYQVADPAPFIDGLPTDTEDLITQVYREIHQIRGKKCRKVAIMLFIEFKSSKEVSELLGITQGTLRVLKSRALNRLKKKFNKGEQDNNAKPLLIILVLLSQNW